MDIKITTFNMENLFTRFDFGAFSDKRDQRYLPPVVRFFGNFADQDQDLSKFEEFRRLVQAATVAQADDKRQHTALAMAEASPMIFCLQEVEGFGALERFRDIYLHKMTPDRFPQLIVHEGNDLRGIDVAAMARDIRPVMTRSHAWLTPSWLGDSRVRCKLTCEFPAIEREIAKRRRIFRRDCLEMEFRNGDRNITIFNCHFKSMSGGRKKTVGVRQLEAVTVREIIRRKFSKPENENWIVVGDLNDYRMQIKVRTERDNSGALKEDVVLLPSNEPSGLDPLIENEFSFNALEKLPERQRWTHYYPDKRSKSQLDYILVSPALRDVVRDVFILRNGLPFRVPNTDDAKRYPRIGYDRPKASDHCPVTATIEL